MSMASQTVPNSIVTELQASITMTRKQLLDFLELAYRDQPNWVYVRSRILRALGRSGLEGAIERALEAASDKAGVAG